jgi:LmbE family N-acetylglucosaminyl deacetylase
MRGFTRRTFLSQAAAGIAVALLPACPKSKSTSAQGASRDGVRFVQVVAHEDDDLLFMNPDLLESIQSGHPTITIFVTSGEAAPSDAAAGAAYAAQRQAGSRAAYAAMAGVPDAWTAGVLDIDATHHVESFVLDGKPSVQLVFVDLPEDADPLVPGGTHSLVRLHDQAAELASFVPVGTRLPAPSRYTKEALVGALAALFARFEPTVLRSQDTLPDARRVASKLWQPYHDHPDHVMTALLVDEAARIYRDSPKHPAVVQLQYRDYNIGQMPNNLGAEQQAAKIAAFATYVQHDANAGATANEGWKRAMYYRWPRGTTWAARDGTDRVHAFAVYAGELVTWQRARDGAWSKPVPIGSRSPLAPGISVASDPRGVLHVVARTLAGDPTIVTMAQTAEGTWPDAWRDLGTPNNDDQRAQIGTPVVTGTRTGVAVFVRNASGGVSGMELAAAGDAPIAWTDHGGSDVQDQPCAIATATGTIALFASTRSGVIAWTQPQAGAPLVIETDFASVPPAGMPVVATTSDGRLHVFYRGEGGAVIGCTREPAGAWGAPAVVAGDRLVLFGRDGTTGVMMAPRPAGGALGAWALFDGELADYPMATLGPGGAIVVLGISPGGGLCVREQAGPDGAFGAWQTINA